MKKSLLLLAFGATSALAQGPQNLSGVDALDFINPSDTLLTSDVVVTGTRTEKKLSDSPVLTTLIKAEDLRRGGVTNALDALLDHVPGVVTEANAMGNNLKIRGLNSRYILFLIDGERMVSEGAGGNINLDQIDMESIERIEVINGAASALYGSNAVGAVINFITKQSSTSFSADAKASYESYNTLKTRVGLSANKNKFYIAASGMYNHSDGYNIEDGAYSARYDDAGADLKVKYKASDNLSAGVTGRYFRHEVFNPDNALMYTHPLSHNVTMGANVDYSSPNKKYALTASTNFTNYYDMEFDEDENQANLDNRASYLSTRVLNTFTPNELWEIVAGVEQNHEESYSTTLFGGAAKTELLDDYNLFAQAQFEAFKNFDIVAGARYTYNTRYKSSLNPKLSLMYRTGSFTFRGGIGSAFRAPSIKELYYDFYHSGGGGFMVYGNPNLKAERGLYNSLSGEYSRNGLYVSVSGYINNIDDKIDQYSVIEGGVESRYYTNISSATLQGVDVNVSYNLLRTVLLKGSYSYCDAVDNSTGLQLSSNVKHSSTISATWNAKFEDFPFSLQLAGRLSSPKLYEYAYTDESGVQVTELSQSKAYDIWKVTFVKPLKINKHLLELTLKCDNIFGFEDTSFINPGRTYMVGLRYKFN